MVKTLTQIVATILTVEVGFVAAYVIYLFSYQSNIDEKISIEGQKIAAELLKADVTGFPGLPEKSLLNRYRELYPTRAKVYLLNKIAEDLSFNWSQADARHGLSAFESSKKRHPFRSGIFIALMRQYVVHLTTVSNPYLLFPAGGMHITSSHGGDFYISQHYTERFPFGMAGAHRWSDEFLLIYNSVRLLDYMTDYYLDDFDKFVDNLGESDVSGKFKKLYKKFDLKAWYSNVRGIFSRIETHNHRIQTLLQLKESFSFKNHLPNVTWLLCCAIISFLLGVFVPLVMMGLNLEKIPSPVNLILLVTTFSFMSGGIYYLWRDISSTSRMDLKTRYIDPLTEQFREDANNAEKVVTFNYDIVNQTLSEPEESKLPSELRELIAEYQDAVIETNRHSRNLAEMLTDSLRKNEIIKRNSLDPSSGGTRVEAFRLLLSADYKQQFFDQLREKKGPQILGLTLSHIGVFREIVTIRPPDDQEESTLLIAEIDRIIGDLVSKPEYRVCISKRDSLRRPRKALSDKLDSF